MLTDLWRDIISIGGFLATFVALVYTIYQVRKAKSAAEAARQAANQTLEESRRHFQRYIAANAHRFINEAGLHIDNQEWERASLRLGDVADHVAQFGTRESDWVQMVGDLRSWAGTFARIASGKRQTFSTTKWLEFLRLVQARIDEWHTPFATLKEVKRDDSP